MRFGNFLQIIMCYVKGKSRKTNSPFWGAAKMNFVAAATEVEAVEWRDINAN